MPCPSHGFMLHSSTHSDNAANVIWLRNRFDAPEKFYIFTFTFTCTATVGSIVWSVLFVVKYFWL